MPSTRSAPVKVVVFQCPCGTEARHRSPRRARPRNRAILVEAPVSSMKTRCSGSRSGWAANQARRRAATSGRSCSAACAVFFEGHAVAIKAAPHCARCERGPMLGAQHLSQLNQADVLLCGYGRQDHRAERLYAMRSRVAALRLGLDRARPVDGFHPPNSARGRDPKPIGCPTTGHAPRYGGHQARTKVERQWLPHAYWPPASLNGESHLARIGESHSIQIGRVPL